MIEYSVRPVGEPTMNAYARKIREEITDPFERAEWLQRQKGYLGHGMSGAVFLKDDGEMPHAWKLYYNPQEMRQELLDLYESVMDATSLQYMFSYDKSRGIADFEYIYGLDDRKTFPANWLKMDSVENLLEGLRILGEERGEIDPNAGNIICSPINDIDDAEGFEAIVIDYHPVRNEKPISHNLTRFLRGLSAGVTTYVKNNPDYALNFEGMNLQGSAVSYCIMNRTLDLFESCDMQLPDMTRALLPDERVLLFPENAHTTRMSAELTEETNARLSRWGLTIHSG